MTRRVVIYRLGSLGDTVVALPCLHRIAASFPDAERIVLTNVPVSSKAAPLNAILGGSGLVHGSIAYPVGTRSFGALWRLAKELRALKADTLVYLTPPRGLKAAWRDRLYFALCGFRTIVGTPLSADLQNNRRNPDGLIEWECERLARCIAPLGPIALDDRAAWDLHLTDDEREAGRTALLPIAGLPRIAINMGGKVVENDWGLPNWLALIGRMRDSCAGHALLIIGAEEDSPRAETVAAAWGGPVLNACGKLAPRVSAAAMQGSRFFVGHDSGPLHLAACMGVTCIGLYGNKNEPRKWHPYGQRHRILHEMRGVPAITVEQVAAAVEAELRLAPGRVGVRLLQVQPNVDPTGGGPMEGVLQSSLAMIAMGHRVELVTFDDPAAPYLAGYPLTVHALGPTAGKYAYNPRLVPWLRAHAKDYDAVIVNGLWMYHGFGAWRALHGGPVPYFVFTHGMLDPWFKRAYPLKHLRKWLIWPWGDYRLLRDARAVLFTCEEEKLLARRSFWLYKAHEEVVSFGTRTPPADAASSRAAFHARFPELRDKRVLLFLSRIHEKKGCDLLIEAFARVAAVDPALHLVMAGPDHSGLTARLQAMASRLGIADRIAWPGMLQGDVKWGAFHAAEAYLLPSHQENFGIAVAEALGCGLPVLISDKVNIWREIDAARAGFVGTDNVDGTERGLRSWLALDGDERLAMRTRASALFEDKFTVEAMARSVVGTIERLKAAR